MMLVSELLSYIETTGWRNFYFYNLFHADTNNRYGMLKLLLTELSIGKREAGDVRMLHVLILTTQLS